MLLNITDTVSVFKLIAADIEANKEYLTELDTAIGDADHGINMSRGFSVLLPKFDGDFAAIGDVFKVAATTLISTVGGASGPLYGTLFLKMAGTLNSEETDLQGFCTALSIGIDGVKARGKAEKGEKTMLDVLIPVLESLQASASNGVSEADAYEKAVEIAKEGYEFTKTIIATKGRASYLGERSLGHIDPGSMSAYLMIKAIADYGSGRR